MGKVRTKNCVREVMDLIFDDDVKAKIDRLKTFANSNELSLKTVKLMADNILPPVGDIKGFSIKLGNYRVVYSIEMQPKMKCAHLSVSRAERRFVKKDARVATSGALHL